MQSFLSDPLNVAQYHSEYLKILNFYQNTKRPSCFVKYYNIKNEKSVREEKLESTYDLYNISDIKFDIYDLTPTNYVLPITNMTSPVTDLAGQMYDGVETIVVYTIRRPRIHDLVTFYPPVNSGETFRVSSIRTQINAIHSEPALNWFELQLEYAPTGDLNTNKLKIDKQFVYDLSTEKYIEKEEYIKYISKLDKLRNELEKLDPFYYFRLDLYCVDYRYIPIETNELVVFIKNEFNDKYRNLFTDIKKPYGYLDKFSMTYDSIETLPFQKEQNFYTIYDKEEDTIRKYYFDKNIIESTLDIILLISYNIYQVMVNG